VAHFWIDNDGTAELTLDPDSLVVPDGFSIESSFARSLRPFGPRTSLAIRLDAAAPGVYSGEVRFDTNDADENPFSFTISGEVTSATGPITVDDFGLYRDTGTEGDLTTCNPKLTGVVNGNFSGGYVHVEFDHDEDHQEIEGVVEVPTTSSKFLYDPRDYDETLVGYVGSLSVYYRIVQYDAGGNVVAAGDWVEFAFALLALPGASYVVAEFALLNDTGESPADAVTSDPTLLVRVDTEETEKTHVSVQFECAGAVNGLATTGYDGTATYLPVGLPYGAPTDVRARVLEWDSEYGMYLIGDWTAPITVTLKSDPPPAIGELRLANDTGENDADNISTDVTLVGHVTPEADAPGNLEIQFDQDGDAQVDGTETTGDNGQFTYSPEELEEGQVTIRARAVEHGVGWTAYSPWASISFVYSSDPDGQEAQALVAGLNQFDQDWQTARDDYETALANARLRAGDARRKSAGAAAGGRAGLLGHVGHALRRRVRPAVSRRRRRRPELLLSVPPHGERRPGSSGPGRHRRLRRGRGCGEPPIRHRRRSPRAQLSS